MRTVEVLMLGAVLAWPVSGLAQSADATRAAARRLANEGVADYQSGAYQPASEKLQRAFATVQAPSIGLWSARALAKLGLLVQASERYLEVTRLDAKQGDENVQKQAQADATREYDELQARIPTLTIELTGAARAETARITVDGNAVSRSLLGAAVPLDPGRHRVEAKQGTGVTSASVTLIEGKHETLRLTLRESPAAQPTDTEGPPAPATESSPSTQANPASPARDAPEPHAGRPVPTATWVGLGLAGVGIAAGTVTGLMAKNQRAELSPRCPHDLCDSKDQAAVDKMNALRLVSTIAFVVGGVAAAGAGVSWFVGRPEPKRAHVQPFLGVASLGIEGAF
jgi:hypothetical protein